MLLIFPHRPYSDCNEINITLLKINRMKKIKSFFLPYWLILSDSFFFSFCLSVSLCLSVYFLLSLSLCLFLSVSFCLCLNLSLSLSLFLSFSFFSYFISFLKKNQAMKFFSGFSDFGLYFRVIGSLGPRNWAVNGGLPLTAGPLTQGFLALQKPIKIWDLSK